jgi:hypothetical protein
MTYLTELEREFVLRRLEEEKRALWSAERSASRTVGGELRKSRPASKVGISIFLSSSFELLASGFNLVEQMNLMY